MKTRAILLSMKTARSSGFDSDHPENAKEVPVFMLPKRTPAMGHSTRHSAC